MSSPSPSRPNFEIPRQQHSCVACRTRKVRCVRPQTDGPEGSTYSTPCEACKRYGIECYTELKRKRRPPISSAARRSQSVKSPDLTTAKPLAGSTHPTILPLPLPSPRPGESSHTYGPMPMYPNHIPPPPPANILPPSTSPSYPLIPSPYDPTSIALNSALRSSTSQPLCRIEDVLSRDLAVYILNLQFDYVHPVISLLHKPTFMSRLQAQDDLKDPLFLGLVFSVLSVALVQIPSGLIQMTKDALLDTARKCYRCSHVVIMDCYEQPPQVDLIILRFFGCIYAFLTGQLGMRGAAHGECTRLCLQMGLHQEATYDKLDPIETEIRRRTFTLIFGSEIATAVLNNMTSIATWSRVDWDAYLPREIDDEFITRNTYLQPPSGTTSRLVGFNAVIKLFIAMSKTIYIRQKTTVPATFDSISVLDGLQELLKINEAMHKDITDLPDEFQLREQPTIKRSMDTWDTEALAELGDYLASADSSPPGIGLSESFLIIQANIWVTWAVARLFIKVAAEELLGRSGPVGDSHRNAAQGVLAFAPAKLAEKDKIVTDLLYALRCIPVQALAANGRSLLDKIRFVAVTLLDSIPLTNGTVPDEGHAKLLNFLEILTEIESHYAV